MSENGNPVVRNSYMIHFSLAACHTHEPYFYTLSWTLCFRPILGGITFQCPM